MSAIVKQRIQKIISNYGYCSRRKAEDLIKQGKVRVNGKNVKLGDSATEQDIITVEGEKLKKQQKIYIMLNKPRGYECTLKETRKNVLKLVDTKERVYPVGRLDKNASGILLLTNDGNFSNNIMHPSKEINKTYLATLDKEILKEDLAKLNKGIRLQDGKVFPKVSRINKRNIKIIIHEGKKHIIKRMVFKVGYFVKKLTRTQIGSLRLNVKEGKWRYLTEKDRQKIIKKK